MQINIHKTFGNFIKISPLCKKVSTSSTHFELLVIECYQWKIWICLKSFVMIHQKMTFVHHVTHFHSHSTNTSNTPISIRKEMRKHHWVEFGVIEGRLWFFSMTYSHNPPIIFN